MLKVLRSLFSSGRGLKPDEYTSVVHHAGREYVIHDGPGLKAEQDHPGQECEAEDSVGELGNLGQECEAGDSVDVLSDHGQEFEAEDSINVENPLGNDHTESIGFFEALFEPTVTGMDINPASGLPMMDGVVDVDGNFYGFSDNDGIELGAGCDISDSCGIGVDIGSSFDDDF